MTMFLQRPQHSGGVSVASPTQLQKNDGLPPTPPSFHMPWPAPGLLSKGIDPVVKPAVRPHENKRVIGLIYAQECSQPPTPERRQQHTRTKRNCAEARAASCLPLYRLAHAVRHKPRHSHMQGSDGSVRLESCSPSPYDEEDELGPVESVE